MRDYKQLRGYGSLEEYGFNCLTGEACAYSMRLLMDMNEKGAELFRKFKGLPYDCTLLDSWNNFVDGDQAVASAMMTRGELRDLMRYVLYDVDGYQYVYEHDGIGEMYGSHSPLEHFDGKDDWGVYRNPNYSTDAEWHSKQRGDRNVHQMSGRSE